MAMKSLSPKQVIVTGLTIAVMLGGSVWYTSRQPALAQAAGVQQQAPGGQNQQGQSDSKEGQDKQTRGFHKQMPIIDEAAGILAMDKESLQAALKDKTLAEIAKEKGVSEAELISKLKQVRIQKIDEAVQAGKLTADKAEKIKSGIEKHLEFMVNHKGAKFFGKHGIKRHGMLPSPGKLAALLGISEDELKTGLKDGKSLSEIAATKGISREQLIAKIKDQMTPAIEKLVDHKRGQTSEKQ